MRRPQLLHHRRLQIQLYRKQQLRHLPPVPIQDDYGECHHWQWYIRNISRIVVSNCSDLPSRIIGFSIELCVQLLEWGE